MSPSARDATLARLLGVTAVIVALILGLLIAFLIREAWAGAIQIGPIRFLTDESWHPTAGHFGLLPMLFASILLAAGAIAIAAPLGLASAIFCRFYAPASVARLYRWTIVLLAGMPSVALGLWGLTVVVPLIGMWQPPGASLLAGVLVLSLMIVPTVALTSEAAFAAVPRPYLAGAAALGLSREATILGVALPAARASIAAGILLAVARALGETMAVLMVSGNVVQTPTSVFEPVRALTANIALELPYATGEHRAGLFVSGVFLIGIVLALAALAARLTARHGHD